MAVSGTHATEEGDGCLHILIVPHMCMLEAIHSTGIVDEGYSEERDWCSSQWHPTHHERGTYTQHVHVYVHVCMLMHTLDVQSSALRHPGILLRKPRI